MTKYANKCINMNDIKNVTFEVNELLIIYNALHFYYFNSNNKDKRISDLMIDVYCKLQDLGFIKKGDDNGKETNEEKTN